MRPDMDKVLCERPRRGARWKRRSRYRGPLEDAPCFEAVSRLRNGTKSLNEHLGPLRRWLVRQVGRPWNDVYSELRANISPNSAVQMHIWQHAQHYVAQRVVLVRGYPQVPLPDGSFRNRGTLNLRYCPVYVCPDSGLLRRTPEQPNTRKRQQKQERAQRRAEGLERARQRKKRGGRTKPRVRAPERREDLDAAPMVEDRTPPRT